MNLQNAFLSKNLFAEKLPPSLPTLPNHWFGREPGHSLLQEVAPSEAKKKYEMQNDEASSLSNEPQQIYKS